MSLMQHHNFGSLCYRAEGVVQKGRTVINIGVADDYRRIGFKVFFSHRPFCRSSRVFLFRQHHFIGQGCVNQLSFLVGVEHTLAAIIPLGKQQSALDIVECDLDHRDAFLKALTNALDGLEVCISGFVKA